MVWISRARASTRGRRALLAGSPVVLLLALGACAGTQHATGARTAPTTHRAVARVITDSAQVKRILPGTAELPQGWKTVEGPPAGQFHSATASAAAAYQTGPRTVAILDVYAFPTVEEAHRLYVAMSEMTSGALVKGQGKPLGTSFGDESAGSFGSDVNPRSFVRVGTVVCTVTGELTGPALEGVTRVLAERAQQAEDGRLPSAVFAGLPNGSRLVPAS